MVVLEFLVATIRDLELVDVETFQQNNVAWVVVLLAGRFRLFDGRSASYGHFFILCCAFLPADADGANDVLAVSDGHTALQRREVRRQRCHGEPTLVDDILEIARRLLEKR